MNINEIKAEIEIKQKDINKNIRIINSFEDYNRDFEFDDNYKNEKEIKEKCEIFINNNKISFNYFYELEKEGKYEIKYMFNTQNIISLVICSLNVII